MAVLLGWLVAGAPAAAQMLTDPSSRHPAGVPEIVPYQDWLLSCVRDNVPPTCQLQPARLDATGPASVALVIVPAPQGDGPPVMIVRSPLGVLLAEGITLTIDGRTIGRLAFQTCDEAGCVAPARLEGALAQALRRGRALQAELTLRDGTSARSAVSLLGITAGLRAMTER